MSPSRSHSLAADIRLTMSGSFNLGMGNLERGRSGVVAGPRSIISSRSPAHKGTTRAPGRIEARR